MTIKWYNGKKWETFFAGAFQRIKLDLKNIIHAINRMGEVTKVSGHRYKNLSDLYNVSTARSNLNCVNDMSLLSDGVHTHDDFKKKLEKEEKRALKQLQADIDYVNSLTPCPGSV